MKARFIGTVDLFNFRPPVNPLLIFMVTWLATRPKRAIAEQVCTSWTQNLGYGSQFTIISRMYRRYQPSL